MRNKTINARPAGCTNGELSPLQQAEARAVARWIVDTGVTPDELCAWERVGGQGNDPLHEQWYDLLDDTLVLAREATGATSLCTLAQCAREIVAYHASVKATLTTDERAELEALRAFKAAVEAERDAAIREAAE